MTTGQLIKKARTAANMTQRELAEKLNIPYQSISQWERDARNPRYETLEKIAEALGTPVEVMISEPVKELESSAGFPRLEATSESLQNWLEQIESDIRKAKEQNSDERTRTPVEMQTTYDSIREFICEREKEESRVRKLAQMEEKRKDYQERLSKLLECLTGPALKKVLDYVMLLSKDPESQYILNSKQEQQKTIQIESCEWLEFQYEQAQAQFQKIKNLPYDLETRCSFMLYQEKMWPDVVQHLMKTRITHFSAKMLYGPLKM